MKVYLNILVFNFYQFIHYPTEIIAAFLNKFLTIFFAVLFWQIVLREVGQEDRIIELLAYFMIAEGLAEISLVYRQKLGSQLRKSIKSGSITNELIKPYKTLPAMYAAVWGMRSINNIPSIVLIIVGVIIASPQSPLGIILFIFFCIISMAVAFSINLFEGVLTFYIVEPSGIVNGVAHISRLLSGSVIPLTFFPPALQSIVIYLPFSMMIFTPISMLQVTAINNDVIKLILVGIFWAVLLNSVVYYFWRRGLKQYEAIGL
jgi:ABC-2 type transport system permease protein